MACRKKNLKRICIVAFVMSIACTTFGCGSKEDATVVEETKDETSIVESFVGSWSDTNSERCWLTIDSSDGVNYQIEVNWSQSSFENYRWELTGVYDESEEGIKYSGSEILEVYFDDGTVEETCIYEDGEGVFYIGRNGKLYWEDHIEQRGEDCVFEKSGTQEENATVAEFDAEWYRTYQYFKSGAGDTIEFVFYDGADFFGVFMNGMEAFDVECEQYTAESDGSYAYPALMGNGELRYYPENNHILVNCDGEIIEFFPTDALDTGSDIVDDGKKYVTDTVISDKLNVHVWFAYTQKEYGNMYVNVLCNVTNCSGQDLYLDTSSYFKLNNNGIIKSGYCDYDYAQMASGATISTWIKFCYPENANIDLSAMIMNMDGQEVCLGDKPQSGAQLKQLPGVYYLDTGANLKLCIEQLADGTYQLIGFDPYFGAQIYTFVLNGDNTFEYDGHPCVWFPEEHCIVDQFAGQRYYKK